MSVPQQIGERIVRRCAELGFAAAGIASAQPSERSAELSAWLAAGKHGGMAYLQDHAEIRKDPQKFVPGARSIVMVADQYEARATASAAVDTLPSAQTPARGRIARYARGSDYHDVIKRRLHTICDELRAQFPPEQFRAFVDTAPVMEREYAARAGLGWIGKHTLVIHPRLGSWLLLGGIVTTLKIEPPPQQPVVEDHCGTCTRCIDACPTNAITPYSVDARRCIAYLTIEHRGQIDPSLAAGVGDWVFGCDICQEVCPHNSPRAGDVDVGAPRGDYAPKVVSLPLLEVLGWKPEDRSRELRGSAMKRATLPMIKRNAIIAMGNTQHAEDAVARAEFSSRLRELAADEHEDALVRQQAHRTATMS